MPSQAGIDVTLVPPSPNTKATNAQMKYRCFSPLSSLIMSTLATSPFPYSQHQQHNQPLHDQATISLASCSASVADLSHPDVRQGEAWVGQEEVQRITPHNPLQYHLHSYVSR